MAAQLVGFALQVVAIEELLGQVLVLLVAAALLLQRLQGLDSLAALPAQVVQLLLAALQLLLFAALFALLLMELALQRFQALQGLLQAGAVLAQGLHFSPPQLEVGFPLAEGLQGRALGCVDRFEPGSQAAQRFHRRFQLGLALDGLGEGLVGLLHPFGCQGQGAARFHLARGGEQGIELLLNLLTDQPVEARFEGGAGTPLLQLLHQPLQVVAIGWSTEQILAGFTLAHPQVGPALG